MYVVIAHFFNFAKTQVVGVVNSVEELEAEVARLSAEPDTPWVRLEHYGPFEPGKVVLATRDGVPDGWTN